MPPDPTMIALDLETTGLDPGSDRVVEIGALIFQPDGRVTDRFERLINPRRPLSAQASEVNGLSDLDLADAPVAAEVLPDFLAFLDLAPGAPLLAHNAAFDAGFLGMEFTRAGLPIPDRPVLDTLALARALRPDLKSHRLDRLLLEYEIAPKARHRALADAEAVKELWLRLGGPSLPSQSRTAYPIHDGTRPIRPPAGWERLDEALGRGRSVRIAYVGGTRGPAPRLVTPRAFALRGGVAYLVAVCHLDSIEKSFRLDRIQMYEVLD